MRKTVLTLLLAFSALILQAYPKPCDHPRLLLKAGEEEQVRSAIASQQVMASMDSVLMLYCKSVMDLPPHPKKMAGQRIERMSEPLRRIFALSFAYRVHGERKYADRAIQEMLNTASYDGWNPKHYLDTSELTMALAIGYDWLFDLLTDEQKRIIAEAVKKYGFDTSFNDRYAWFYTATHNWNQVCNAGLVYGAIAFWDEYNAEANTILDKCFASNHLVLRDGYSDEGAYAEGYGYWGYGSSFQILLIAALESAFGSDLGLMDGYEKFFLSGHFMQMMNRPNGYCFNYADCARGASAQHMLSWLARKTGDYSLLYLELRKLKKKNFAYPSMDMQDLVPCFLICGKDMDFSKVTKPEKNIFVAGGQTPIFIYRSGWDSPDDVYLGIKGGTASSNHGHQDVGSFIFDADGVTWADDLGSQSYLSLESRGIDLWNRWQSSDRYKVLRISPFVHNIITVNSHQPDVYQYVSFKKTYSTADMKGVEMNLKMPYWEDLSSYNRLILLEGSKDPVLSIYEDIKARENPAEVRWSMCTMADAEVIDSNTIKLSKRGHVRYLKIDSVVAAEAAVWSAQPQTDYDQPNPADRLVGFTFKLAPFEKTVVRVQLIKEK